MHLVVACYGKMTKVAANYATACLIVFAVLELDIERKHRDRENWLGNWILLAAEAVRAI